MLEHRAISEWRIINFSRGFEVPLSQMNALQPVYKIYSAQAAYLAKRGFSLVYPSGNNKIADGEQATPIKDWVSIPALLGKKGAIIVGGAHDQFRIPPGGGGIFLSAATYGDVVELVKSIDGPFTKKLRFTIPDVCGFCGPKRGAALRRRSQRRDADTAAG
jgi:hypothetical protein